MENADITSIIGFALIIAFGVLLLIVGTIGGVLFIVVGIGAIIKYIPLMRENMELHKQIPELIDDCLQRFERLDQISEKEREQWK